MIDRFTIRPRTLEYESLTGYLDRAFIKNKFSLGSFRKIGGLTLNNTISDLNHYHMLDFYPEKVICLERLSHLLNRDIQEIKKMTYTYTFGAFSKFSDNHVHANRSVLDQLVTQNRRFCTACLLEGITHKLLWQVKEIQICNIHKIRLEDSCNKCGKPQPYMNRSNIVRRFCNYCNLNLVKNKNSIISLDGDLISQQLIIYEDWRILLDPNLSEYHLFKEDRLNYITALYYVNQGMPEVYDKSLGVMGSLQESILNNYLKRGNDSLNCITLERTFNFIRQRKITLKQFLNLVIPSQYVNSLNEALFKPEKSLKPGKCYSPWCTYYQDSSGMNTIKRTTPYINYKKTKYLTPCICQGCRIIYGYDSNQNWIEVDEYIKLGYEQILPLLNKGYSLEKIRRNVSIPYPYLRKLIGYFSKHDMLSDKIKNKFKPAHIEGDVLYKFIYLDRIPGVKVTEAKKVFSWKERDYYYYLATDEVQDYFVHNAKKLGQNDTGIRDKWMPKVSKALQDLYHQEVTITFQEVAATLDICPSLLNLYNFNEIISDYQNQQNQQKIAGFYEKAEMYIKSVGEKPSLSIEDLCKFTGYSKKWISHNIVNFKAWFNMQKDKQRLQFLKLKEEQYKIKTKHIVKEVNLDGQKLTMQELADRLGCNVRTLRRNQVYSKIIQDFKGDKSREKKRNG